MSVRDYRAARRHVGRAVGGGGLVYETSSGQCSETIVGWENEERGKRKRRKVRGGGVVKREYQMYGSSSIQILYVHEWYIQV